ncbi:TraB/VirB10 family protein, partial [Helicobacter pullorum]
DCFITGEGYGDLTSERAYIRTNTLSCMANDGRHINLDFKGAVSGEDGKIGLKGRVVTKQGALLARTLIAGFLQGVGESFGQQDTTTIVSGSGTTTVPLDQTANEAFQQGLFQGLSDSAEKLADFYLKMADQISPVIEISAGREITVITTDLTEIKSIEEEAKKSTQIILNNQIQKDKR